jgi:hypothetical protein
MPSSFNKAGSTCCCVADNRRAGTAISRPRRFLCWIFVVIDGGQIRCWRISPKVVPWCRMPCSEPFAVEPLLTAGDVQFIPACRPSRG